MSASRPPVDGDRVLVLRWKWLQLILDCEKSMEIRSMPLRAGFYFLGCKGKVYGSCTIGDAVRIDTRRIWQQMSNRHRVSGRELPYKRTFGLPLSNVRHMRPMRYHHPRGAIGIVKFRPE